MKIGLLREEKSPPDKRVVFTPDQCAIINQTYSQVDLVVLSSSIRCFTDDEYIDKGVKVVDNLADCDILLGIKEVPKELLIANKVYFYFSHTIKKQPYNRSLLAKMVELGITMVDYEVLIGRGGGRLLGFGRYAGVVGAYNAFLTYGLKSRNYSLKPAYLCKDRLEMEEELSKLNLVSERIVITGKGRVGRGIIEIMRKSMIREVSVEDFLNKKFSEAIFVCLDTMDYNERIDGSLSDKKDFYNHPELYRSSFLRFAEQADIFIAGHYYSSGSPYLFTSKEVGLDSFRIGVVADISCDINGPIASTIRDSTIDEPIYGYDKKSGQEVFFENQAAIAVMAVSNLPCELPKDASEDFGKEMLEKILPLIIDGDKDSIIRNGTICSGGDLTSEFEYLRDYLNED